MQTFAQNFEDVMLERIFAGQDRGFYVDVGAWDPTVHSVTRHFYDKGWRGVNIEPIRARYELLCRERPRDINLNVAIGEAPGLLRFYECVEESYLSTLDPETAEALRARGLTVEEYDVEVVTLADVFARHSPGEVDFLKIDVEGWETQVLRSANLATHQPRVLVIECVEPGSRPDRWETFEPKGTWGAWEPMLIEAGYSFTYFDGLNRFYLRDRDKHLAKCFALPPGVFDEVEYPHGLGELVTLRHENAARLELIERLDRELREANQDRVAREGVIQDFRARLSASEETNAARQQIIDQQAGRIAQLGRDLDGLRQKQAERMSELNAELNRLYQELNRLHQEQAARSRLVAVVERGAHYATRVNPRAMARQTHGLVRAVGRRVLRSGGLWRLHQYPPRPMVLPDSYQRQRPLTHVPKISIVTPSFNSAEFIEETITSVLSQNYANLEYICQDGASTDGTAEIIKKYADRLHAWKSEPDSGQTNALNKGFAKTTGEILAYLNSDDVLLPGALNYAAAFFNAHPEVDVIYSHRIMIDEHGMEVGRWILPPHDDHVLKYADYVPQETMFWRRRIFDKVGGRFDESFTFAMDWDLILRFQKAGARFVRVPRFLGAFRVHTAQKSQAVISDVGEREMARLRERHLGHAPDRAEIHRNLRPYVLKHVLINFAYERGLLRA